MGKIRCPLRPAVDDPGPGPPEILTPPEHPPACCTQQTVTVPADVLAKTAQKHDYPSKAHRRSYARRTGAERGFATAKDPATNDISRGWCRLMGLAPLMLFTTTLLIVRNQRILAAWNARQEENAAPRRRRAPPENPQAPPQNPRQPHHSAAIAQPRTPTPAPGTTDHQRRQRKHARKQASGTESNQPGTHRTQHGRHPRRNHRRVWNVRPKREHGPH